MSEGLLSDAAVQAIKDSERTHLIEIGNETFTSRPTYLPPAEPQPQPLTVVTLQGLIDFLKADQAVRPVCGLHIAGHDRVNLVGPIAGRHNQRATYAIAAVAACEFKFGVYHPAETFVISLQSAFVGSAERDALLQFAGRVTEEYLATSVDDGITQVASTRTGVTLQEQSRVPNPVYLAPFRTFRELIQPASPFVFRVSKGPTLALFEADGGAWKLDAIRRIKMYLETALVEEGLDIKIFA